jgi:hypothetical protein
VPLRRKAEEKGRGKGLKAVWGDENETVVRPEKKINVLVKECFGAVLPEPVEGMRDRWAG